MKYSILAATLMAASLAQAEPQTPTQPEVQRPAHMQQGPGARGSSDLERGARQGHPSPAGYGQGILERVKQLDAQAAARHMQTIQQGQSCSQGAKSMAELRECKERQATELKKQREQHREKVSAMREKLQAHQQGMPRGQDVLGPRQVAVPGNEAATQPQGWAAGMGPGQFQDLRGKGGPNARPGRQGGDFRSPPSPAQ